MHQSLSEHASVHSITCWWPVCSSLRLSPPTHSDRHVHTVGRFADTSCHGSPISNVNKKDVRAKRPASLRVGGDPIRRVNCCSSQIFPRCGPLDVANKNIRSPRPAHASAFDPSRLPDKADTTITLNHPLLASSLRFQCFPPLPEQLTLLTRCFQTRQ